ncbi:MAG: FG-GAP-like repeat-containing protein [candidate division WOR-3 bacterium]|nr:FG-GAP-like repeat-containing protein [candidate division WOR-3 bacterium]
MNRLVLVLAFLAAAVPARADIIYVPSQYPTIQQGIDAAVAGDIVMVAPGTYVEETNLKAGVVVQGAGEGLSTIDGGGDAGDVVRAIGNAITSDTKLKGFTITGALNGGGMPGGGGVFCNSGARPEITNCRISGNDCGIALWNGSVAYIANNVIADNTYFGVSTGSDATVVNNTIHNCRIGFSDDSGYGPVFMNNIVTGCSMYGVYGPGGGTPPALTYNDVWHNAVNYHQATPGIGSDSLAPVYTDSAGRDFHLQAGSPCIDAGNPAPQYNDPDGTRNDMGAYGGPGAVSNLPAVTSLVPARNALDVSVATSALAGFSVPMDPATLSAASFRMYSQLTGWRFGAVTYDSVGHVAELDPDEELRPGELVTAELTNAVRSSGGDSFPGCLWQFFSAAGGGSGRFANPATVPTHSGANNIITADFNRDGDIDLAVVNFGAGDIAILLGQGNGGFDTFAFYALGAEPEAACAGDFDSDSILDIAVAVSGSNHVAVLLGNGDGTFAAPVTCPTGLNPFGLCAADLNLDGVLDLASSCAGDDRVALLLGNGNGTFASATYCSTGTAPWAVASADFNNDGWPDLITANSVSNNVSLLLGRGDGTFVPAADFAAGRSPAAVVAGDLNADGSVDVAVANQNADSISVLMGDGQGGLGTGTRYADPGEPTGLALADLNGDGALDLASANTTGLGRAVVFLNNGRGAFAPGTRYQAGADAASVTAGDFDSDGDLDLAVANYGSDDVSVLLNEEALAITALVPGQYEIGAPDTTLVSAGFNLPLDPSTLDSTSFLVRGARTGLRHGAVSYDSAAHVAWFDPAADFMTGEPVVATLTKAIRGSNGTYLGGFGWTFTTAIPFASSGTFAAQNAFPTGSEPRGLVCADFDADGDVDIVTTSNSPAAAALLRNNGDGTFAAPSYTTVNDDPIAVFAADFDSDHDVDLAVFHNEPGTSHLEILKNDGSGTFANAGTYVPATLGQYISGADFDGDGDVDIVVTDGMGSQNNVRVMTNNGSGTLTGPASYSAGSWAHGVAALDVDNDGDFDIACCNQGNDNVSVLYNDGSGTFSRLANFTAMAGPEALYANDLNGDGRADLAVVSTSIASVAILLNNGNGGYYAPATYSIPSAAHTIEDGDFDGDGDIDLGVASDNGTSAYVLLNNGDGTFGTAASYATGSGTWTIGIADFDRDGALDLATTNYSANNVSILLATGLGVSTQPYTVHRASFTVSPNPFRGRLSINCKLPTADGKLRIYDVQGCLVRSFSQSSLVNRHSSMSVVWDGTDSRGARVAPGLYFVTLASGNSRTSAKVVLSR